MNRVEGDRVEELARLLDAGTPPDEAADELGQLLTMARGVSDHSVVPSPTPWFRARLRDELIDQAENLQLTLLDRIRDAIRERTAGWRYSLRIAMASALTSTLVGTAGVAVAAQQAMPGDVLYEVKRWTEHARLAVAGSMLEAGRLHLQFADERLEEVVTGYDRMSPDVTIATLEAMEDATRAGAADLMTVHRRTDHHGLMRELRDFMSHQRRELSTIFDELAFEVRPVAAHSLDMLQQLIVRARAASVAAADCTGCRGPEAGSRPGVDLPGTVPCDCDVRGGFQLPGVDGGTVTREPDTTDEPTTRRRAVPEQPDDGATTSAPDDDATGPRGEAPDPSNPLDQLDEGVEDVGDAVEDGVDKGTDGLAPDVTSSETSNDTIVDDLTGTDSNLGGLDGLLPDPDPTDGSRQGDLDSGL